MIIKRWSERAGCRVALWHSATQSPGEPPLFLFYRKLLGGEIRVGGWGRGEQRCRHCAPYWSSHKAGIPVAATTLEKDAALLLCPSSHSLSPFSSWFRPAPLPPPPPPPGAQCPPTTVVSLRGTNVPAPHTDPFMEGHCSSLFDAPKQ